MDEMKPCPNPWCEKTPWVPGELIIRVTKIGEDGRALGERRMCACCGLLGPVAKDDDEALALWNTRSPDPSRDMAGQWQDIATAPGPYVYIWLSDGFSMRIGFWADGEQHENFGTKGGGWIDFSLAEAGRGPRGLRFAPTHWQPLPPPPTTSAGEGGA